MEATTKADKATQAAQIWAGYASNYNRQAQNAGSALQAWTLAHEAAKAAAIAEEAANWAGTQEAQDAASDAAEFAEQARDAAKAREEEEVNDEAWKLRKQLEEEFQD